MNLYPKFTSTKVLPYVYKCIHKNTSEVYYGYRAVNKIPSHLDFPKYRTSSKVVKPNFDEYDWYIVAEFFNPSDAYDFEQELIYEQWKINKEISLNKRCYKNSRAKFITLGTISKLKCVSKSIITRSRMSDARKLLYINNPNALEKQIKIAISVGKLNLGKKHSNEFREYCSLRSAGSNNGNAHKISINGTIFLTKKEAYEELNISKYLLNLRLSSVNYPDYFEI